MPSVLRTGVLLLLPWGCALVVVGTAAAQLFPGSIYPTPALGFESSVASGDLNGDGRLDLVVSLQVSGMLRVFVADGDGGVVQLADVASPTRELRDIGDLTGDGFADLVAVNVGAPYFVYLFAGDGAGGLTTPMAYPVGQRIGQTVLADVDEDGHLDLVGVGGFAATTGVVVLPGDGAGGLAAPLLSPMASSGNSSLLSAGDFDEDGHLDVVVGSAFGCCTDVEVLLGDGDGGFASLGLEPVDADVVRSLDVGDLDGDDHLDLVVTLGSLSGSDAVGVLHGDGSGDLSPQSSITWPGHPDLGVVDLYDLEPDGDLDLLLGIGDAVNVAGNDGSGAFGSPEYLLPYGRLAIGPLDGDGWPDVYVVFADFVDGGLTVFTGLPGGGFDVPPRYPTFPSSGGLAVSDLDGDGELDVVRGQSPTNDPPVLAVQLGDGAGGFLPVTILPTPTGAEHVAVGDLDEDGAADLVAGSESGQTVFVLRGDGLGGFGAPSTVAAGAHPAAVGLADFDGDGHLDVVALRWGLGGAGSVALLEGDGAGGLALGGSVAVPAGGGKLDVADIDHDGDPDVVSATPTGVTVVAGDGAGGFVSVVHYPVSGQPLEAVVADVDLDGDSDIAATSLDGTFAILLGDGAGGFGAAHVQSAGSGQQSYALDVADVTGDGLPDLLVSRNTQNRVFVLAGHGTDVFTLESGGYVVGISPDPIDAVDLDHDGRPDLVAGGVSYTSVLRGIAAPFTWKQLGHALAGAVEAPVLTGQGTLATGSTVKLSLVNAKPLSAAYVIASATNLSAPFKGGVLVPFPSIVVLVGTNAAGAFTLSGTVAAGIPPAFTHDFQVWVVDPAGPAGFSASGAISGTTP